jgi:peroxiredoxin
LAAWEERKAELEELGATVYAISTGALEESQEVADRGLTFPIAYGATREDADLIDAWWDENRGGYIQPAEFLLGRGGVVLGAMYASGPVGRMGVEEAVRLITSREQRRREQEQAETTAAR